MWISMAWLLVRWLPLGGRVGLGVVADLALRLTDASQFKSTMFAAYPLYLPVYLGEYELNEQRATVVVFAASQKKVRSLHF